MERKQTRTGADAEVPRSEPPAGCSSKAAVPKNCQARRPSRRWSECWRKHAATARPMSLSTAVDAPGGLAIMAWGVEWKLRIRCYRAGPRRRSRRSTSWWPGTASACTVSSSICVWMRADRGHGAGDILAGVSRPAPVPRAVGVSTWLYRIAHSICLRKRQRPAATGISLDEMAEAVTTAPARAADPTPIRRKIIANCGRRWIGQCAISPSHAAGFILREIEGCPPKRSPPPWLPRRPSRRLHRAPPS